MKTSLNKIGAVVGFLFLILSHGFADTPPQQQNFPPHWRPKLIDQRIYWAGTQGPSGSDIADLEALIQAVFKSPAAPETQIQLIQIYVSSHKTSGWTPALQSLLGEMYLKRGQFTLSLETWRSVWQQTKHIPQGQEGKHVADIVLVNLTRLLAMLGRYDELTELFQETKGRILDRGPLSQEYSRTREAYRQMARHPEISYRCGTLAMFDVCSQIFGTNFNFRALTKIGSSSNGFTLNQLVNISDRLGLGLAAVRRSSSAPLIVPSVVNWKQHHYGAIVSVRNGIYEVKDLTMVKPKFLTADEITSEASGYYLVPKTLLDDQCFAVSKEDGDTVYGKGNPDFLGDSDDQQCTTCPCPTGAGPGNGPNSPSALNASDSGQTCACGSSSGSSASGMPQWSVSEPYIDLWFQDEPVAYQPAFGPRMPFRLYYHERGDDDFEAAPGLNWSSDWFQEIDDEYGLYSTELSLPGNGISEFDAPPGGDLTDGATNYFNNYVLVAYTNSSGQASAFQVERPDGTICIYSNEDFQYFYISEEIDPHGNAIHFYYSAYPGSPYDVLLTYVVDATGLTNTIMWNYDTGYITNIINPFHQSVTLRQDENGALTNIVDAAGMSTSISYNENGLATNLITPYGTNTFQDILDTGGEEAVGRALLASDTMGGQYLYYFSQDGTGIVYPSSEYPTNTPFNTFDTNGPGGVNSLYWGPRQYPMLSSAFRDSLNFSMLTTSDIIRARLRHWLMVEYGGPMNTISLEEAPSPDGITSGQTTWFDYTGVLESGWQGNQILPAVRARVMPDGSTQYVWDQRDHWGHVTNEITHWFENGQDQYMTNVFIYSTNEMDVLYAIGADGVTNGAYAYDANHSVLAVTNALNEVTLYTYNANEQITSITTPNGQVTTNIYDQGDHLAQQIVWDVSTNSYAWSNDLVYTHTDDRGLTVTNSYDSLNRLTNIAYPDDTCMSYIYSNLDVVSAIDRLKNVTSYAYNALRQKVAVTDPLTRSTYYDYCTCGSLESIQDPLGNITRFYYDNAGRLTNRAYPDGYSQTFIYNLLDKIAITSDNSGAITTNSYDNLQRLISSRNNVGQVLGCIYDIDGRLTNRVDANNVSVGMAYDNLNRLLTRRYPDGGIEAYGYTSDILGPTAYTNEIGDVWFYSYDGVNRKTNEFCVGVTTNVFAYDGAGDLVRLVDGNENPTSWGYDQYGRVTNKVDATTTTIFMYQYDADSRLTNRWTPAKGTTVYRYDPVGNLTNVDYSGGTSYAPAISMAYDADNRLINMVDGIGTTAYGYDQVGELISEGGLWPGDTVTNGYQNHLRMETAVEQPGGSPWEEAYQYDAARRLTNVMSPAGSFGYIYDPTKLQRVDKLTLPGGAYITNSFDSLARELSTVMFNSGGTDVDSAIYAYNPAGQRTNEINAAGDYRNYGYDNEGELVSAVGKESGGTSRLQEQFGYAYDAAGNLNFRTNNALIQTFNVNNLNELTMATNHGTLTVAGTTTIPVTSVTVNGSSANHYADSTFALGGFTVANGLNTFTAIGEDSLGDFSTNSVTVNLPATNNYSYDQNGNLLSDGTRNFTYDDENELIGVCVSNAWSNSFAFDGKMRRRIERDYSWSGSAWQKTNEIHFIYDGNVVIEERNSGNVPLVDYTRGNDMSGKFQRAGGIGGLLARTHNGEEVPGSALTNEFYHCDGNGNVTCLMFANQQIAAKYFYDPYGNMLAMNGPLAGANKYRFSNKEWNENAGLYYYLYRFYDPNLQRWLNRDPLGDAVQLQLFYPEQVGLLLRARHMVPPNEFSEDPNLYLFVANSPVSETDPFGLCCDVEGCGLAIANCLLADAAGALICVEGSQRACYLAYLQANITCAAVPSACAGCGPPLQPPNFPTVPGPF